jgi:hypothetical protein
MGLRFEPAIRRKQVPIEPKIAMTAQKAQEWIVGQIAAGLAGCAGNELPYVMDSRAISLDGLCVARLRLRTDCETAVRSV